MHIEDKQEFASRLAVFSRNMDVVSEHNAGNSSFTLGRNQWSHLTFEEFETAYLSTPSPRTEGTRMVNAFEGAALPMSVDWTTTGAVR